VGTSIAVVMAIAMFIRAQTMAVDPAIAVAVAVAAVFIVIWSAFVAAVLPLVLNRIGLDPAVVSAPLIITLVDATGLVMYLYIARAVLGL